MIVTKKSKLTALAALCMYCSKGQIARLRTLIHIKLGGCHCTTLRTPSLGMHAVGKGSNNRISGPTGR